jgi:hypothetical protein
MGDLPCRLLMLDGAALWLACQDNEQLMFLALGNLLEGQVLPLHACHPKVYMNININSIAN